MAKTTHPAGRTLAAQLSDHTATAVEAGPRLALLGGKPLEHNLAAACNLSALIAIGACATGRLTIFEGLGAGE